MPDIQVSNARRVVFTALALVMFWVLAWRMYWFGCNDRYHRATYFMWLDFFPNDQLWRDFLWDWSQVLTVAATSLPVSALLWFAGFGPRRAWRPLVLLVLPALMLWMFFELGDIDVVEDRMRSSPRWLTGDEFWSTHRVSWFWLLLPLILTTALVIVGAWRQAVRDAEAAAGEDDV